MRILMTNSNLSHRGGSELYLRDLSLALRRRGHTPIAYSQALGVVAEEMHEAGVLVIDRLDAMTEAPDVIHGQHHLETMSALVRFPGAPAVYVCHGWQPWLETPPVFPRIGRYVAVQPSIVEQMTLGRGIPRDRVEVIRNWVDLERFKARSRPLPERPRRALIFSNYADADHVTPFVQEACARLGIELDVIGSTTGRVCPAPEKLLEIFDLVFGVGRSALEALAVGCAVILASRRNLGPMVTSASYDRLRTDNLGFRATREPWTVAGVLEQIRRYDRADAARLSETVRQEADLEPAVDRFVAIYESVMTEPAPARSAETRALLDYLCWLTPRVSRCEALERHNEQLEKDVEALYERISASTAPAAWRALPARVRRGIAAAPGMRRLAGLLRRAR